MAKHCQLYACPRRIPHHSGAKDRIGRGAPLEGFPDPK